MTTRADLHRDGATPLPLGQLALIEARRSTRQVSIWVGFVLTIGIVAGSTTADWAGGSYTEKLQGFMPIVLGTFIAAYRTGRRDADHTLAESSPLGPGDRALARLASIALPILLTSLVIIGLAIVSRIEGGFWVGDEPRRTDAALHPFVELLQPPLLVAFVGALGIACGRARGRLSVGLAILFGVMLASMFPGYWIWNIPPAHTVAPFQTQPLNVKLDDSVTVDQLPADWYVENSEHEGLQRQLVHRPTIAGHDIYLVGLTALAAGLAVRETRGRRLVLLGIALALAGIVVQIAVSPF